MCCVPPAHTHQPFDFARIYNHGLKGQHSVPRDVSFPKLVFLFVGPPPPPTKHRCCTSDFPPVHTHIFHRCTSICGSARRRLPNTKVTPVLFHQCTSTFSTGALLHSLLRHAHGAPHPCVFLAPGIGYHGFVAACGVACSFLPDASCPPDAPPKNQPTMGCTTGVCAPRCFYRRPFASITCHLNYATVNAKDRDS